MIGNDSDAARVLNSFSSNSPVYLCKNCAQRVTSMKFGTVVV